MDTFLGVDGRPHPQGRMVLADLKRLSKKNDGGLIVSPITRTVDPYATMHANGRREVYDRIIKMLGLEDFDDQPEENSNAGSSTEPT